MPPSHSVPDDDRPQFTTIVMTNRLPSLPGNDPVTWRRIRIIRFEVDDFINDDFIDTTRTELRVNTSVGGIDNTQVNDDELYNILPSADDSIRIGYQRSSSINGSRSEYQINSRPLSFMPPPLEDVRDMPPTYYDDMPPLVDG